MQISIRLVSNWRNLVSIKNFAGSKISSFTEIGLANTNPQRQKIIVLD